MEVDLEKRVKELQETKQKEEAEELKRLQELRQGRQRIERSMQEPPATSAPEQPTTPKDAQPGTAPVMGASGHPENKPELKDLELDAKRIEAREAAPAKLTTEGMRRMQGQKPGEGGSGHPERF